MGIPTSTLTLLRAAPFAIEPVQVKPLRIEDATDPPDHVLMLLVVAITHDLEEQRVAVRATHVIRRARILTRDTRRQRQLGARPVRW